MTEILVIVVPMVTACVIAFVLGASWQARRSERDAEEHERIMERLWDERIVHHGDQWPANLGDIS